MDPPSPGGAPYPSPPSPYTTFNSALTAGLLNPMSPPPLPRPRSTTPTLFHIMSAEPDFTPSSPPLDPQTLLQSRIASIISASSPGNQIGDPQSGDVRLTLRSTDGLSLLLTVHRQILVAHSRFFAAKLSDRWSRHQRSLPHLVEISDCDDIEVYVETLGLMYCGDLRLRLMRENVSKVLGILKVDLGNFRSDLGFVSFSSYNTYLVYMWKTLNLNITPIPLYFTCFCKISEGFRRPELLCSGNSNFSSSSHSSSSSPSKSKP